MPSDDVVGLWTGIVSEERKCSLGSEGRGLGVGDGGGREDERMRG